MSAHEGELLEDPQMYRQMVGSLIYLTITRLDLSQSVGVVSQFMQSPWKPLDAVRRSMRYVKHTLDYGLHYRGGIEPELLAYTGADWAGNADDRRSTSGYVSALQEQAQPYHECERSNPQFNHHRGKRLSTEEQQLQHVRPCGYAACLCRLGWR